MKKLKIFKAFTLVELIIVITILAILSTIAFVSFQSYTASARDSNRQITLKEISKSLDINKVVTGTYPVPESIYATGNIIGTNLFQVGVIGDNISRLLKINKTPLDPISNTNYLYGLSLDNKYYQIAGTAENLSAGIISQTYAESNEKLKAVVEGNYKGLLYFSTGSNRFIANFPSIIFSRSGTYTGTGNYYIVNGKTNIPYSLKGNTFDNPKDADVLLTELYNSGVTLTGVVFNYSKEDFSRLSTMPTELGKLGIDSKEVIGQIVYGNTYSSSVAWSSIGGGNQSCPTNSTPESYFNFDPDSKSLYGFNGGYGYGDIMDVIIPCQINGVDVENINENSFTNRGLTSLVLPPTIKTIGNYAFKGNNFVSVTNVDGTISDKFIYIKKEDGTLEIKQYFGNDKNVDIPSEINGLTVTNIGNYSFSNLALLSVKIPNTIKVIGERAFIYNNLVNLSLPTSVSEVGSFSFGYNPNLTNLIVYSENVKFYNSVFNGTSINSITNYDGFVSNEYIYSKISDSTISIGYHIFKSINITIPSLINGKTVVQIGDYAFYSEPYGGVNKRSASIVIPSTIITIGNYSFYGNLLTNFNIPTSVTSIGNYAFGENSISTISMNNLSCMGEYIFYGNPVTSFSYNGNSSTYLYSVNINGEVQLEKYLGAKNSTITIPSSINGLTVKKIGNNLFSSSSISSLVIPSNITYIGDYAFRGNLLTTLSIPNSVTYIGYGAFNQNNINLLTIGTSVTYVGGWAFSENKLTSVTIPNSVTSIGDYAFGYNGLSQDSNTITTWSSGLGGTWNLNGTDWEKQ